MIDRLDDDMHVFRIFSPSYDPPAPALLPDKRHPVLDVDRTVVSTSLIRRIENELRNNEYDPRTVFNSCRGLTKGSLEFEEAYIAARIRSFAKHQRFASDPLLDSRNNPLDAPLNSCRYIMNPNTTPSHPMAVNHLGHLMSHFGIWVIALLGIQLLAAWRIGAFANTYLEGGRNFHFAVVVFLMLALDSGVWFRRRGNLCQAFLFPGAMLFMAALLPVVILHVRETLLAIR